MYQNHKVIFLITCLKVSSDLGCGSAETIIVAEEAVPISNVSSGSFDLLHVSQLMLNFGAWKAKHDMQEISKC